MSRTSRIPHPPGSRFVSVYHWAVKRFGLAGAAVLGVLDFWDRGQDSAEQPLGSRNRIVTELEGVVGRNLVDGALRDLVAAGVIRAHKVTVPGKRNLQTWVNYGLNLSGLVDLLANAGTPGIGSPGESRNRESSELPVPGPVPGVPSKDKEIEVEAAAPRAPARGTADAAASTLIQTGKRRIKRPSGVVTWIPSDINDAERIEQENSPSAITAAVSILMTANKEPVPGLVGQEIERQKRLSSTQQQQASAEAARQARLAAPLPTDLAAQERGARLFNEICRKRETAKNAQA